jgi:hypothetical protein
MNQSEKELRKQLVAFLRGGHAYSVFDDIVKNFPMSKINTKVPNSTYTPWGLLEHIRITQWDILDFSRNSKYKEMKWPEDYWPNPKQKGTPALWKKSVTQFKKDREEFIHLLENPKNDLNKKIPWGDGQTILREALLIIDHNSYHLGEFSILRDVMKTWKK